MSDVGIGKLFPEILIASISTGLLIAVLINKERDSRGILLSILFVTTFFSATAGLVRHYANVSIENRCTWQRPSLSSHISRSNRTVTADVICALTEGTCAITSTTSDNGDDTDNTDNDKACNTGNNHSKDNQQTIAGFFLWLQASNISLSDDSKNMESENTDIEVSSEVSNSNSPYDNNHGISRVTTRQWSDIVKSFLQPSRITLLLLHGPAVTLILYITARLFAVRKFHTNPVQLDFGSNSAFGSQGGHPLGSLSGFLSAFLSFPAVSGTLVRSIANFFPQRTNEPDKSMSTGCLRGFVAITRLTYSFLTLYPTYIFLKPLIAGGDQLKVFASSSYASDCSEWVVGYVVGVAEGMFVTSIVMRLVVVDLPKRYEGGLLAYMKTYEVTIQRPMTQREEEEECPQQLDQCRSEESREEWNDHEVDGVQTTVAANKTEKKYAFGKLEEYTTTRSSSCSRETILYNFYHLDILPTTNMLSIIPLSMFMLSTPVCGVYLGATWNTCPEGDGDKCSETNGVDWSYTLPYIFTFSFVAIEGIFFLFAKGKHGPFKYC